MSSEPSADSHATRASSNPPPKLSWGEFFSSSTPNFLEFLLQQSPKFGQKYGDIVKLSSKQYLVTGPNAFKHILKTKPSAFTKRNRTYDRIKHILGNGLIVNDDSIWERHQKPLHEFFNRDRMHHFANVMIATTEEHLNHFTNKKIKTIDFVKEMTYLTLKIAFKSFCNHQPTTQELKQINFAILQGTPHISHALFLTPWIPTFSNLMFFWSMRRIKQILKNMMVQRSNEVSLHNDYLDLLLSLQKPNGRATSDVESLAFSEQEVIDELQTILFTGHETSTCALAWVWHLLSRHPEYRLLLEQELETVLGKRNPTFEDCNSLAMTKAIFLETLRLYPPIWCLPRTNDQTETVDGFTIPAKSQLILNVHALHRNPLYWDNPDQFYPPRFLGENASQGLSSTQRHPYAFLPFSIGKHACIGSHFAITEGILLIAMISQRFRLNALYDTHKITPMPYLSLRPPKNLMMRLVSRSSNVQK